MDLAGMCGLVLDDWQQFVLEHALGETPRGGWSAFEVCVEVPRQNGKGSLLEARELAGLFLFGEELLLHSAHEFRTASEGFRRVLGLIESTRELERRVKRVNRSHGDEGIELVTGQRLRFVARTGGSGRGFSGDCVILDEAFKLDAAAMAALLPTLSARRNPQLWYASSAPLSYSEQLHAVRERALAGDTGRLAYFEWSAPDGAEPDDREAWATANPALGIRITEEFIEAERAAMPAHEFGRERLGFPDALAADSSSVIHMPTWDALTDVASEVEGGVVFAVDVSPDRQAASVAVAGPRTDGLWHVEVVPWSTRLDAVRPYGTAWVVPRVLELVERWQPLAVVVDPGSAAGSIITELLEAGVEPLTTKARDVAQGCGSFYDAVANGSLRHLGQLELRSAVDSVRQRPLGDAWAWNRRQGGDEITPVVAATLALWGAMVKRADAAGRDVAGSVW